MVFRNFGLSLVDTDSTITIASRLGRRRTAERGCGLGGRGWIADGVASVFALGTVVEGGRTE